MRLLPLLLLLLSSAAQAAKIPVIVNVGVGPTVATVGNPTSGSMPVSAGLSLQVEGWVSRKTLRSKAVRRMVPQQYRGMVKQLEDLHVTPLPLWVVPDEIFLTSLDDARPTLRGASWAPWSVQLLHSPKGPHTSLSLAPRVSWLSLSAPGVAAQGLPWLGASLDPEVQTKMNQRVGVAVAGSVGAGWTPALESPAALGMAGVPWLQASGSVRLQLRFPIEVQP